MKKYINFISAVIIASLTFSCNDDNDYIIGGNINETNKVDLTTFDYLSSLNETKIVATLFEKAGLKDVVNGDVTVVAPNVWSVNRYLRRRYNQALRSNPSADSITINDISADDLKKMGMYILPGKYSIETIPEGGKIMKAYDGTDVCISVDEVDSDPGAASFTYSSFMEDVPNIVHIHYKRGSNWEWTALERSSLTKYYDNPECDHVYRMYLSNIITKNGVVHILYSGDAGFSDHTYYHCLFDFGTTSDDTF